LIINNRTNQKLKNDEVSGLDVHKGTVFCSIYNGEIPWEVKEFPTVTASIRETGSYIQEAGVEKIAMESTGTYWIIM